MKHLHTFEEFLTESKILNVNEELQKDGLDFVLSRALSWAIKLKGYKGYKDNDPSSYENTIFSLIYYKGDWASSGLDPEFFKGKNPGAYMKDIAKEATNFLKTGKGDTNLIEFLTYLYYKSFGGRIQNLDDERKKMTSQLTPETAKNPSLISAFGIFIPVLKSWSSGPAAARLNLALAVNEKFLYGRYAGYDFPKVYKMAIEGLRKNRVKLTPTSKIEFNNETSSISRDTISNSIGFSQVDISRWSSYITAIIDGKEFVVGSFESQSGYGRY